MIELKRPDLKVVTTEGESLTLPKAPKPPSVELAEWKIGLGMLRIVQEHGCNPEFVAMMCEIAKKRIKGLS